MRARVGCVLVLALALGCRKVPVAGVFCDGSERWRCSDPAFPSCDLARRLCVAGPGADLGSDGGSCARALDCPAERPLCDGLRCRACSNGDDAACAARSPSTPRCFVASGRCAACAVAGSESADCAPATPVCGDGGVCRACATHDECNARLCDSDGSCAPAGSVAYADNRDGACTGAHAATVDDPACDIAAALAVRAIVRVFGSSVAYPRLSLGAGDLRIVGPDATPTARLSGDLTNPAIGISGTGTRVLLDRLEVTGGGTGQDGIACFNGSLGPTLTLLRSLVHGVSGAAVSASKCTVILDRDQLGPLDAGGGLVLGGSSFTVTNCFIVGNGNGGFGVSIGPASSALGVGFMHNSVANNAGGGILCSAATAIVSSIVSGNTPLDVSGTCTLTSSTTMAPQFVSASDLHLAGRTAANLACCIDRIASSPIDHDFDGRARPQPVNGAWDVGAHEVP
jgi:hypothetical protein